MRLIKGLESRSTDEWFGAEVRVDSSICYDFVVSLRALFNPRTFTRSRQWAAAQLPLLGEDVIPKGKFLFQGFETALGYGAARVVQRLPDAATPSDLIDAVRDMPAIELAMFMLDTGETSSTRLKLFRQVLDGDEAWLGDAVDGLPSGWESRCREVLRRPDAIQADLVEVLEAYLARVYAEHLEAVTESISESISGALKLLEVLPATEAIERLTGGYTLGADLELRSITLAPSVFIYPFMSTRVDEETAGALILYGIPSDIFAPYDPVPMRAELVTALKAMANPSRLTVLRLLAEQPMYTTEIVQRLRLAQTTVHHHLAQLRSAGLVRQERDRNGMKYSIRQDSAMEVLRALDAWLLGSTPKATPTKEAQP